RSERGARADEAMEVMRALWKGGPVAHHGRFFHFDDIELRPVHPPGTTRSAMKTGGPPLLVSGRREPAMRRAARLGDGWMPYLISPRRYAESVGKVKAFAAEAGRDLSRFEWLEYLFTVVDDDPLRARQQAAAFLGGTY